jgi:hypothetical protein
MIDTRQPRLLPRIFYIHVSDLWARKIKPLFF